MRMMKRGLDPAFFSNEELAALEPIARILFAGLWLVADREGRLEDRPTRLKAILLPYDNVDVDLLLRSIAEGGHIIRYEIDGIRIIQIASWEKYGNPYTHEKESALSPISDSISSTLNQGCVNVGSTLAQGIRLKIKDKKSEIRNKKSSNKVVLFPTPEGWKNIPEAQMEIWQSAYPGVNVKQELLKALAWVMAHPEKHCKNYLKFLNGWISRTEPQPTQPTRGPLRFSSHGGKTMDEINAEMEKQS